MNSRVFYTLIRLAVVCAALGLAAGCDDVSTAELKTPVYKTGLEGLRRQQDLGVSQGLSHSGRQLTTATTNPRS